MKSVSCVTCAFVLLSLAFSLPAHSKVVYVDKNATGATNDGASWSTAYTTLTAGLAAATSGDEVWVAKGTYAELLTMSSGVALYGGFAGTEIDRSYRDWQRNVTVLDYGIACSDQGIVDGFKLHGVTCNSLLATVTNNIISEGVIVQNGTAVIANNVISASSSDGVWVQSGTVTLVNNTICSSGRHGIYIEGGTVTVVNNIIAFNAGRAAYVAYGAQIPTFSYNDGFANAMGDWPGVALDVQEGNIHQDPKLSSLYHDIHIQPDSPCIDSGSDQAVIRTTDIDGQPRIAGAHVDMGADETDGTTWVIPSQVWYISATGDDNNDGLTWQTARKSLTRLFPLVQGGDEVWVARGTYVQNLTMPAGVTLLGGFAGTETRRDQRDIKANPTVLDGGGTTVVTCKYQGSAIDGFTICNGGNSKYGVYVKSGTTTITRNVITNTGAGVYGADYGTISVIGNILCGNNASGMYIDGAATVVNNTICANEFWGIVIGGAAVVTVAGNTVTGNGDDGVRINGGTMSFANNIIAFNGLNGIYFKYGDVRLVSHNDVFGNGAANYFDLKDQTGTSGNISVDPQLSNLYHDVHIQPNSPCRNAGDSEVAVGYADVDGQPRTEGSSVDIGSDESDGMLWSIPSRTWYVSPVGSDANDGTSWALAKKTVVAAVSSALGGDEIWVAQGSYSDVISLPAGVSLYGGFEGTETRRDQRKAKASPTVLDGNGGHQILTCRSYGVTVDGFTIRNGGTGVTVRGAAIVVNNIITNHGTGVDLKHGRVRLRDNTISSCRATGVNTASGTVADLTNNTLCGNGVGLNIAGKVSLANNIIAFSTTAGFWLSSSVVSVFSHNDVFSNAQRDFVNYTPPADQGNISLDPLFVDRANGDLHLQANSPCIDAGDDSVVLSGETDLDGYPRILGTHADIGAYEHGVVPSPYTVLDVLRTLRIAAGLPDADGDDLDRLNVESANPSIDLQDAFRLARKVAGLEANP